MKSLPRLEAIAALVAFSLIFVSGIAGQIALRLGVSDSVVKVAVPAAILLLFCVFGFALIGLMLHVFIALQMRAGNAATPMIRFLAEHERGVTFAFWGFLGLGAMIALPFALADMAGLQMPIGRSKGLLVADIGMTFDDVRRRSTLKIKDPSVQPDGSQRGTEDVVFDYQIGESKVRFPQSRYYWLETAKNDPRITTLNIGITPSKMSAPDLEAFQHRLQGELLADGWMPGHFIAHDERTVHLWAGRHTDGDGRYWARGDTLLTFARNRMDDEKPGEPPGSGEFILYIQLRPNSEEPELVFERSAWPN